MRRWTLGLLTALAVGMAAIALSLSSEEGGPQVSSEGRSPAGLRGAVAVAEEAGVPVVSWRHPLDDLPGALPDDDARQLLLLSLPSRRRITTADQQVLQDWLEAGHTLVLQFDGTTRAPDALTSSSPLQLRLRKVPRRTGSIAERAAPAVWAASEEAAPPVVLRPPVRVAADQPGDRILYGSRDVGAVRVREIGSGTLVLMDGHALSNRWLARSVGNRALWEQLLADVDGVWFDDYHQGLVAVELLARDTPRWPYTALLVHLGLLWMVGIWCVARPFGPRPAPAGAPTSSVARQLNDLARIHDHHGHAAGAVELLRRHAATALDDSSEDLLTLARELADLQRTGRLT